MLVVDASVMYVALANDDFVGRRLRQRFRAERVAVPEVHDLEVLSTIRGLLLGGKITRADADDILRDHSAMRLDRYSHRAHLDRIWQLRRTLSAFDAAYAALAETLHATLLTGNRGLSEVSGLTCDVELITSG